MLQLKVSWFLPAMLCLLSHCLAADPAAEVMGTGFSYQGRLQESGVPATGLYDLQLTLWKAAKGGAAVSEPAELLNVGVTNGLFNVKVDFGPVFDGSDCWLEIKARPANTDVYTLLSPRQPVAAVPFANLAQTARTLTGPLADRQLTGSYSQTVDFNSPLNTFTGSFTGNGANLTNVPASAVVGGLAIANAVTNNHNSGITLTNRANVLAGTFSGDGSGLELLGAIAAINVKAPPYNAVGDGIADDTAALQQALNSIDVDGTNATIYVPPGTYRLTGGLALPMSSGWTFTGAGPGRTRLTWASTTTGWGLGLTNYGGSNCRITHMSIEGPTATVENNAERSVGLQLGMPIEESVWAASNWTIENCWITGWGSGVTCSNMWTSQFRNCAISSNVLYGIRFSRTHNPLVQQCTIAGTLTQPTGTGVGFCGEAGDDAEVSRCTIFLCTNAIVNFELALNVYGNHLESCGSYLTSYRGAINIVQGCYFLDHDLPWTNGFQALMLFDSATARNTTLFGNNWGPASRGYMFSVTNDGSGYAYPSVVGRGKHYLDPAVYGSYDTNTVVLAYPFTSSEAPFQPGKALTPIWNYQLPLRNGADAMAGMSIAQSPEPWSVNGAMRVDKGEQGLLEFPIPHGLGFSNMVLELTIQGAPGQTNQGFSILQQNYSIGPAGRISYGGTGTVFRGLTNGYTSTLYWTNSFGEDIYPRRCRYSFNSFDYYSAPVTDDIWILSFRLFSVETR